MDLERTPTLVVGQEYSANWPYVVFFFSLRKRPWYSIGRPKGPNDYGPKMTGPFLARKEPDRRSCCHAVTIEMIFQKQVLSKMHA